MAFYGSICCYKHAREKALLFDANKSVVFDGVLFLLLLASSSSCLLLLYRSRSPYKDSYQILSSWRSVAELEFVLKLVFLH